MKPVMKWHWLKLLDLDAGMLYTFYDAKGCSLADWRRYLSRRYSPEIAAEMLSSQSERYDVHFYGMSQFGEIRDVD